MRSVKSALRAPDRVLVYLCGRALPVGVDLRAAHGGIDTGQRASPISQIFHSYRHTTVILNRGMNGGNGGRRRQVLWRLKNFCAALNGPKTRSFLDFFRRISIECGFFSPDAVRTTRTSMYSLTRDDGPVMNAQKAGSLNATDTPWHSSTQRSETLPATSQKHARRGRRRRREGADLLLLTELFISGYPPEDLS